jgi:hypothetical protein
VGYFNGSYKKSLPCGVPQEWRKWGISEDSEEQELFSQG